MALVGGEVDERTGSEFKPIPAFEAGNVGLRSRPGSSVQDSQVRVFKSSLVERLGPYEPVVTWLQSVLLWEKPLHSVLLYLLVNAIFWFFALTSLRLVFLLSFGLTVVVCIDTWKNKIWPQIRVVCFVQYSSNLFSCISWGLVHPRLLSVPELCHHMAEIWVCGASFARNLAHFKQHNPGKSAFKMLSVLLWPLAVYHSLGQRIRNRLEPALLQLDFSVRGYMMSKQKERQMRRKPFSQEPLADGSDSEEELAAFCPKLDDSLVARELAITDSEHSDAEVSYTDNGTFNLSRGQTPLTEGSEDLDRHSDPEESFARDLPDFPSINPDATLLDDDDDTSIGIPNVPYRSLTQEEASLYSDQEDIDTELPSAHDFTSDIAGIIASNMIQAALVGAIQGPARRDNPQRAPPRGYRKQSSSELDTDVIY
ncbi:UNVERIFIED_CONTAM: hypothetical protein FKN15_051688 [Acipenser sinensis]